MKFSKDSSWLIRDFCFKLLFISKWFVNSFKLFLDDLIKQLWKIGSLSNTIICLSSISIWKFLEVNLIPCISKIEIILVSGFISLISKDTSFSLYIFIDGSFNEVFLIFVLTK